VSKDDPPFITFHGTKDQRVSFLHAMLIHEAVGKAGVPSLLVPITDGGHGSVSQPEVIKRGREFIGKILVGIESTIDTTPIPALPEAKK
jgi:dipeptidyl aminopeptidase/acylaminoacyl peptidase